MGRALDLGGSVPYVITPMILLTELSGLTDAEKITLQILMYFDFGKVVYRDGKPTLISKGYCDVSLGKLSKLRGIHRRTIQVHLSRLRELGYIEQPVECGKANRKYINLEQKLEQGKELKAQLGELGLNRYRADDLDNIEEEKDSTPFVEAKTAPLKRDFGTLIERKATPKEYNKNKNNNKYLTTTSSASPSEVEVIEPIESIDIDSCSPSLKANEIDKPYDELTSMDINSLVSGTKVDLDIGTKNKGIKKNPIDGIRQKIATGDYGKITAKDILIYFKEKHLLTYHLQCSVPAKHTSKILSMLSNGFIAKYGQKRCIELVDLLFEYHRESGLATSEYPRPIIYNLTQDWVLNKIIDTAQRYTEINNLEIENEVKIERATTIGPEEPIQPSQIDQETKVFLIKCSIFDRFCRLARQGYISKELMTRIKDKDKSIVEEVRAIGN